MQNEYTRTELFQKQLFGQRYVGATLANVSLPGRSAEKVAAWIKNPKDFIVLTGPSGTGKTYFCSAIIDQMAHRAQSIRGYNERDLLRKVRDTIGNGSSGDYLQHLHMFIDDPLIIIDDVGSSGHTDWREEVLMETIDYRYAKELPMIVTSNLHKQEFFAQYGQRITSRLFSKENICISMNGMVDHRAPMVIGNPDDIKPFMAVEEDV